MFEGAIRRQRASDEPNRQLGAKSMSIPGRMHRLHFAGVPAIGVGQRVAPLAGAWICGDLVGAGL